MCFVLALARENKCVTPMNIEVTSEHFHLNITTAQGKMVASVLEMTYKLMLVKKYILEFCGYELPREKWELHEELGKEENPCH